KEDLAQLKVVITSRSLPQMWDEFSKFLTSVRSISMDTGQSILAMNTVLRLPASKPEDKPARIEGLNALSSDFSSRLEGYQKELGSNAYAVFNTLTDIAARPPENACFQTGRDTLEKRSGRWLKELARQSQTTGFDLSRWIPAWEAGDGRQIPGRN
ncbi:MAG TPA: hypothetical protein PLB55_23415, partial [Prosthecobacter sp.]|nr:hypothetical protein [Prosthecobacter sp.]